MRRLPQPNGGGRSAVSKVVAATPSCGFKLSFVALSVAGALFSGLALATQISEADLEKNLSDGNGYYRVEDGLTLVDKETNHGGWGYVQPGQVIDVGNGFIFNNTLNRKEPELVFVGNSTSVEVQDAAVKTGDLSVLSVGQNITGKGYIDAQGYTLVSAAAVETTGYIRAFDPTKTITGTVPLTTAGKTLLVFKNLNDDFASSGKFDIQSVADDARLSAGGIYIDTTNLSFNTNALVASYSDIVIDLGAQQATDIVVGSKWFTGAKLDPQSGGKTSHSESISDKLLINKTEGATTQFKLSSTANINTSNLQLTNGATVGVMEAGAVLGRNATSLGEVFTLGGEDFSVGSSTEAANGIINVGSSIDTVVLGGDYYFKGTGASASEAGLITAGSISMAEGAKIGILSLDNAVLGSNGEIDLKLGTLELKNGAYVKSSTVGNKTPSYDITIDADKVELIEHSSLGRAYSVDSTTWMNDRYFSKNTTVTANTITVENSFIFGSDGIKLLPKDENSTLTVSASVLGSAESNVNLSDIHRYGIRTNGAIDIGAQDENGTVTQYFGSVTVSDKATIAADGGDLKMFAKTVTGNGTAQFEARKGKAIIAANSITLNAANSYIKGVGGVEIHNLDQNVLNIKLSSSGQSNPNATDSTLNGSAQITGSYVTIVGDNGINLYNPGAIRATGKNGTGNSILLDGQNGDLKLTDMWVEAGSVDGGQVSLTTNAGNQIYLLRSHVRDDIDEGGKGKLTVAVSGLNEVSSRADADIYFRNSRFSDDEIILGSGYEKIDLVSGVISPDEKITVEANTLALNTARIGGDETSPGGGEVNIYAQNTQLKANGAYITSDAGISIQGSKKEEGAFNVSMADGTYVKGQSVAIGSAEDDRTFSLTGGTITTNGEGDSESITLNLGNGANTVSGTNISSEGAVTVTGQTDGEANLTLSNNGDKNPAAISGTSVTMSGIHDLTVDGNNQGGAENDSHITATGDVNIAASGTVDLGQQGWIKGDGNVVIDTPALSVGKGSHIGVDSEDDEGGNVSITANKVTVEEDGYITSAGSVTVSGKDPAKDLNITLSGNNQGENEGWIKGESVSISGTGVGITGGSISTTGNTGNDINITGGNQGISLNGTGLDAGKGTVNIGSTKDDADSDIRIVFDENDNAVISGGQINIGYVTGDQGAGSSGKVTIENATITSTDKTNGVVNIGIGSSSDSAISGTGITAPTINIGVGEGSVTDVTNSTLQGNTVDFSSNGTGSGSQGQVNFGSGASVTADTTVTVNENVNVEVDGGSISADHIVNNNNTGNKVEVTDNGSYVDLQNPFDDEGNLSFDIAADGGEGLTIEVGDLSQEQFDKFKDLLEDYKDKTTITAVVGVGNGEEKTLEDWDKDLGQGMVAAGGGVDVSEVGTSGRPADSIGHGGGSYLVGSGDGPITVTGPDKGETGKVTITGSQVQEGAESFEIVRPAGAGETGLELEDETHLTLGNSSSWGGHLSGGIAAAENAGSMTVEAIGGRWDIDGDIALGDDGNLIIYDRFDANGSKDAVVNAENVDVGHLQMKGDTTGLNTGNLSVANGANISGGNANENSGAHVNVDGTLDIKGGLTMSGNAMVNVGGNSTVDGGMLVEADASFNGKDLTVTGGDSQFDGAVTVGGDYENADGDTIVNGTTQITGTATIGSEDQPKDLIVGSADATNAPNGSFSAGNTTVSGNFIGHDQSQTTVNGDLTVAGESTIGAGASVAVNGNATMTGGLHVEENGSFVNNAADGETTVNGFLIMDEGSKLQAGNSFSVGAGTSIGTNGDGVLNGLISATDTIDFSQVANSEAGLTFTGEGAGTNAHHINMGSGSITYENGASHVFTKDADDKEGGIVTGTVNIGLGGSVTMDSDMMGSSDKAYLYMNDKLQLSDDSRVIVGDVGDQDTSAPGIYLGNGSSFGLNAGDFTSGDSVLAGAGSFFVGDGAEISISDWGLGTDGTLKLDINLFDSVGTDVDIDSYISNLITSDNVLQDFWYSKDQQALGMDLLSSSTVGTDDMISDVVDAVISSDTENNRKQELIEEVFSKNSGFMTQDADGNWVVSGYGNQRLQDVLTLPIAAGSFNIAYDAMSEMNQSMANRMAEPITAHSLSVWADVIATYNSADELFGNSGYSADIYAGVLGADVGISNDWVAGVAFTIGQGDVEGEGDTMGIKNDADFYGVSLYTVKDLGQLRASADMGYLKVKNDISTNVNYGGKGDTDVLTVGGRLDMTVYQGESFDVTPHFGMRYANFSIDTMNGTATDDINVIEAPIGVTVKGKTTVDGWKVAPAVDVSVVPQFGDKKAKIWNSGVSYTQDVLDPALVRTSVGVTAQKDNFTFGLNYRLGVGANERQNHHFNATVRYQF